MFRYFPCLLTVQLSLLISVGCSESPTDVSNDGHPHDHHEPQSDTLEAAISQVMSLRNTIRDSFAIDDVDTAHGPLHEVGDALLLIPELAKKQKVSAENQSAIEAEVNTLMDGFGAVDKTLHGQEGSTYEEESAKIDTAMTALCLACGVSPDESEMPAETPETLFKKFATEYVRVKDGSSDDWKQFRVDYFDAARSVARDLAPLAVSDAKARTQQKAALMIIKILSKPPSDKEGHLEVFAEFNKMMSAPSIDNTDADISIQPAEIAN